MKIKYDRIMIIAVGNIGSGKSTAARRAAKLGYIITGRDQLRYMIGAGEYTFNLTLEPIVYNMELACADEVMRFGANIFIDEVSMTEKARARYIGLAKQYAYKVGVLLLPRFPKVVCINRRLAKPHGTLSRRVWERVWQKFDDLYQEPKESEGIDCIVSYTDYKDSVRQLTRFLKIIK